MSRKTTDSALFGVAKPAPKNFARERGHTGKKLDHLTLDALAAEAAGMPYGKYKAIHPHTLYEEDQPEKKAPQAAEPEMIGTICARCGKVFYHTRKTASKKYCCEACKEGAYQNRKLARLRGCELTCARCGAVIPHGSSRRKYCSKACLDAARHASYAAKKEERKANGNGQ